MYLVEINSRPASSHHMALTSTPQKAEQKLIGQALQNLRKAKSGINQADVGLPMGIGGAAWSHYELGQREFTAEKIAIALSVIGATEHDLEAEKARILGTTPRRGPGLGEAGVDFVFDLYGRVRSGPHGAEVYDVGEPTRRVDLRQILGRSIDAIEVAGDTMSPWAESGEIVLFDRDRPPRRGKGCVVVLNSGEAYVRLYEKSDGSTLFVTELYPEEKTQSFPLKDVSGVYPVVLRGD